MRNGAPRLASAARMAITSAGRRVQHDGVERHAGVGGRASAGDTCNTCFLRGANATFGELATPARACARRPTAAHGASGLAGDRRAFSRIHAGAMRNVMTHQPATKATTVRGPMTPDNQHGMSAPQLPQAVWPKCPCHTGTIPGVGGGSGAGAALPPACAHQACASAPIREGCRSLRPPTTTRTGHCAQRAADA